MEPKEKSITSQAAEAMGVCIGKNETTSDDDAKEEEPTWQMINDDIEDQSAVTIWRTIQKWPLENARSDTVSLVELKPMTGRYHQLRRHMVSSEEGSIDFFTQYCKFDRLV